MNENKERKMRDANQVILNRMQDEIEQYLTGNEYLVEYLEELIDTINVKLLRIMIITF